MTCLETLKQEIRCSKGHLVARVQHDYKDFMDANYVDVQNICPTCGETVAWHNIGYAPAWEKRLVVFNSPTTRKKMDEIKQLFPAAARVILIVDNHDHERPKTKDYVSVPVDRFEFEPCGEYALCINGANPENFLRIAMRLSKARADWQAWRVYRNKKIKLKLD